jgi:endonuclease YncB( thermonuclease family)
MYDYMAKVIKVYDGDTITVDIDLGFGIELKKQSIRLLGINTPEVRGEEREQGLISKEALSNRILNKTILLKTYKDKKGKYGRWLGEIYLGEENLNEWLINEGYAEKY